MKRIRILYQVFFLGLFLLLVAVMDLSYMKGYPVLWFLQIDPLVALGTSLAAHTLVHGLIWCLVLVGVTVLFGRVFCGWACPLGTLHHFFGALFDARPTPERTASNRFRSLYNLKYYLLVMLLVMAAGNSLQIGWLDPIPFLVRAMAVFVQPTSQWLGQSAGLDAGTSIGTAILILTAAAGLGWCLSRALGKRAGRPGRAVRDALFAAALAAGILILACMSPVDQRRFHWGFWITLVFLVAVALNRVVPRFWCRALCPLGALLGLVAKFSLWQIHRSPEQCKECGLCAADCQGASDPDKLLRKSECFGCLNCRDVCPEGGISYRFMPPVRGELRPSPDLGRRRLIGAASVGAMWILGVRVGGASTRSDRSHRIRPPGSVPEARFLEQCLKCGACMRVCPTNAIQPALSEAGVEGLWSPILVYRVGACEPECTLCGRVCPTGAIRVLTLDEKLGRGRWAGSPVRMGTAFFDRGRCLPWSTGKPCVVCQEVCPVSPKAIYTKPTELTTREGSKVTLGLPHVDPDLCTGCGMCEKECPVHDLRAIRVTSVGETRSSENRMLLGKGGGRTEKE